MMALRVLLVLLAEAGAAFLALDACFRWMDVRPDRLRVSVLRWGVGYGGLGGLLSLLGGLVAGGPVWGRGAVVLAAGFLWWALWHFGLRKQLTFLFQRDDAQRPDL